jgi:hypothetical protein
MQRRHACAGRAIYRRERGPAVRGTSRELLSPSTYAGAVAARYIRVENHVDAAHQRALPGEGGRAQVALLLTVAEDKDDVIAQPWARP